jgi:hypothetical protein
MSYSGIHRATITNVNDPKRLHRVQVRVVGVHDETSPTDTLPWAENGNAPATFMSGDYFPYNEGDKVWVMFEGGQSNYPVYLGGWQSNSQGVNSTPAELVQDLENNGVSHKWVRVDRKGNQLVFNELPEDAGIALISGSCELEVLQSENSINVKVPTGSINMETGSVRSTSRVFVIDSSSLVITGDSVSSLGFADALFDIINNNRVSLSGDNELILGSYVPTLLGVSMCPGTGVGSNRGTSVRPALVSYLVASQKVVVGAKSVASGSPTNSLATPLVPLGTALVEVNGVAINLTGVTSLNVTVGGTTMTITPVGVSVQGNLSVTGNITATGDIVAGTISLRSHTHLYSPGPGGPTPSAPPA